MMLRLHGQAFAVAMHRLGAQPVATLVFVAVLGLALAVPSGAGVLLRSVAAATAELDTDPHVNVFLAVDAVEADVKRVEQALRADSATASLRFIPKAQALADLKATTHLADVLASLDRNPLPDAFSVRVRSTEASRVDAMKAQWSRLPKVDQVVADFEWSERLRRWLDFGKRIVAGMAALLALAIVFIVGQLIRLQVLTHRAEIEVSQLIGATAADVRRPFLYRGLLQGLFAGAGALVIGAGISAWAAFEL